ncbi:hypothetical protein ABGB14_33210 [Nonomuraea sp. B10E15]|uniref:hypothetical protein n=1 Tax=Nonomuraea sp. B10E15 TaxID=3153560 RepID=UPI00325DC3A4
MAGTVCVDLLTGDLGGQLGFQVHVDDVQSPAAALVEFDVQDGPLDGDVDGRLVGRNGGQVFVAGRGHQVVAQLPVVQHGQLGGHHQVALVIDPVARRLAADQRRAVEIGAPASSRLLRRHRPLRDPDRHPSSTP